MTVALPRCRERGEQALIRVLRPLTLKGARVTKGWRGGAAPYPQLGEGVRRVGPGRLSRSRRDILPAR